MRNAARPLTVGVEAGGQLGPPQFEGTRFFPDRFVPRVQFNARVPGGLDFLLNVPTRVLQDPTTGQFFQEQATGSFAFPRAVSPEGTSLGSPGPLDFVATQGPTDFAPLAGVPTLDLDLFDFAAVRGHPGLGFQPSLTHGNVFALANPSFQNVAATSSGFFGPRALQGAQLNAIAAVIAG